VILSEAAAIERHEIAVYERLICDAEAMCQREVVRLLGQNLDQERRTLEEVEHGRRQPARARLVGAA
jgi:ferritin-like metal-binding protein YciE